jgi:hypothetical protein
VAEPRDEFPNHYVGDLVPTEHGWVAITSNSLRQRSGDTYLMLGDHELLLPPILADFMQLPCPTRRSTLPDIETKHRLLFPGRTPHRSIDPGVFARRLKQRGISPRAGRNTALIVRASELPAAVLSDLLGIDIAPLHGGPATPNATGKPTSLTDAKPQRTPGVAPPNKHDFARWGSINVGTTNFVSVQSCRARPYLLRRCPTARSAARCPHMPWGPAPGGVEAEQRYIPGMPVLYGATSFGRATI